MVKDILSFNHIELSSQCQSSTDDITISFSCPSSISEVVLEQLENIGMDSWYGKIYVTACDLYRSSEEDASSELKETMTSRLILVQEMINLINDGAACTFDYILLLISAAMMAATFKADMLVILTTVEKVAINFGKPDQKNLDELTPEEARKYMAEGQFAPGSMLPKVEAAVKFAESKPDRTALITLLEKAKDGIEGKTGTAIHL